MTTNTNPHGPMLSNCSATRTDGAPCAAHPGPNGYCFWHNPETREQMLEASRRGGSRRTIPLALETPLEPDEARAILASVLSAMLTGALDCNSARGAAYILQVESKIQGQELERRVATLESILSQRDET